jgi:hypothetical protein
MNKPQVINFSFDDAPTLKAFMLDKHRIKAVMGPVGSGKSSACVMHLLRTAQQQAVIPGTNVRRTRYVIVRNTVKELKDTTKKTIDEWITPLKPIWRENEQRYLLKFGLEDGTIVDTEWLLRALDRPEQLKDLLSLEVSGAWLNEGREIPKEVFVLLDSRINRYPRKLKEYNFECSYPYIIIDTNPPDVDSWFYKYFEELLNTTPELQTKSIIFKQPSGLSPEAENITNLPTGYYQNLVLGNDPDWVKIYVHGEYGYTRDGKPVFSLFTPSIHISKEPLIPIRGIPLTIGMDFGLYVAAVITQVLPNGVFRVYDELVSEDATDVDTFTVERLLPLLQTKYINWSYTVIGDPAGNARSQLNVTRTCFTTLRSRGIKAFAAYTNSIGARLQAVNNYLTRFIKGEPAFLIDNECKYLIRGLTSKYCFRRLRLVGDRYSDVPDKNMYSHIADALTYAALGYTARQINNEDNTFTHTGINQYGLRAQGWF